MNKMVPEEIIEKAIYLIRGQKVMLDKDLANLYGVKTKVLIQAIKRNLDRFPGDFMFQLDEKETEILRSQFVTSSWGGRRYLPYAFTEHGILMLSSVLNSPQAIQVNIRIMRTFSRLKRMLFKYEGLRKRIVEMEGKYDKQFRVVFDALRKIIEPPLKPKRKIGFLREGEA